MVYNGVACYGATDVYRGLLAAVLGHDERADAWLASGIELNDRIGATFWSIRGRLFWAEELARRGGADDRDRAAALSTQARLAALEFGAPALVEWAEAGIPRVQTG